MTQIPDFPAFRPVELEDRAPLEDTFRGMQPEVSELNFTNIFMFQNVHDYMLSTLNGNTLVLAKSYSGETYFLPPIGEKNIPATMEAMFGYLGGQGLKPAICLAWHAFMERHVFGNESFSFVTDDGDSDYLYMAEDLKTLAGRKFHDKKNLVNRFLRKHEHEYRTLTEEMVPQAKDLVERWCREKCTVESPSTFGETEATMLALGNLNNLSTKGGVVVIKGRVEALSLGEELNRETVVVHVEKANSAFEGLYQFISSEFLKREFPGYKYVNREQDLGEPNLRKSKLSYNHIRLVEKYRVWPKELK